LSFAIEFHHQTRKREKPSNLPGGSRSLLKPASPQTRWGGLNRKPE
jgi:hypothetical protein